MTGFKRTILSRSSHDDRRHRLVSIVAAMDEARVLIEELRSEGVR